MSENVSEVAEVAAVADGAAAESGENKSFIARSSGLKMPDYIGYALGDTACCLVFGLVTSLLQKFYTDIFGLGPLFIMLMMVGARIWDAINDPIMGRIADTIKVSRWGRYRPWFLYASVPLTLASILMFVKWPGMEEGSVGMMVYATVTYVLFGMCYTALQIPYGSLASVVTTDEKERTKLSVFRSVGAGVGSLPVFLLCGQNGRRSARHRRKRQSHSGYAVPARAYRRYRAVAVVVRYAYGGVPLQQGTRQHRTRPQA